MERAANQETKYPTYGTKRRHQRRMAMLCPSCLERICDIPSGSRMIQYLEDDDDRPKSEPEMYVKCRKCGVELLLYQVTG